MLPLHNQILLHAQRIRTAPVEQALAIYISKDQVIASNVISLISLHDQVSLNVRYLFEMGWQYQASGFVLVHSHPSGTVEPSLTDLKATDFLKEISDALDLPLIDHYIVGVSEHFSFQSAGLL